MSKFGPHLTVFFRVFMRCVTWSRDSHGLFDYESRYIHKRNIKTATGGKVIRVDNDVELISKRTPISDFGEDAKPLIVIKEKDGKLDPINDTSNIAPLAAGVGTFNIENDTLVAAKNVDPETMAGQVQQDEDINNKMFLVVRSLKNHSSKIVSSR